LRRAEEAKPEAESKEETIKPDLKKVAENRKRSTGMTAANGRSTGVMTPAAAAELPVTSGQSCPKRIRKPFSHN